MALDPRDFPVQEHALGNGLQVRLLPDGGLPIATSYSFFRVGSRNERPGITGISHLFEHMMFNGAKKYGPGEFDRTLESNGGSSNAYTSNDMTVYYEDFMSEALEKVIDLEADRMRSLAVTPKMIKKHYGPIRPGPRAPPPVLDAEPEQKGERRAEVRYPAQASSLMIAWRGPSAREQDTLVLDVLQYALSVGQSSRLVKSLVYEKEACVSLSIDWSWRKDPGAFVAAMELKPGAEAKDAELALYEELDRVARDGLTDRELQNA